MIYDAAVMSTSTDVNYHDRIDLTPPISLSLDHFKAGVENWLFWRIDLLQKWVAVWSNPFPLK